MSLGLRESRTSKRREGRRRVLKRIFFLGGLLAFGWFSYESGQSVARSDVDRLQTEVLELRNRLEAAETEKVVAQSQLKTATAAEAGWRQRYQDEVPSGEVKDLFAVVQRQVKAGASLERLTTMIQAAGAKLTCENTPATKRFFVRTALNRGAEDTVSFAEGAIVVKAEGQSASSGSGNPEAWYDPAQPITATFLEISGRRTQATGKVPVQHSVIVGNSEYRFSIVGGDRRGFVNITADRCTLPRG